MLLMRHIRSERTIAYAFLLDRPMVRWHWNVWKRDVLLPWRWLLSAYIWGSGQARASKVGIDIVSARSLSRSRLSLMQQLVPEGWIVAESSVRSEQRTGFTLEMVVANISRNDVVVEGVEWLCCTAPPPRRFLVKRGHTWAGVNVSSSAWYRASASTRKPLCTLRSPTHSVLKV